jgi:hypothetical protein
MTEEEMFQEAGFESAAEGHKMIASVDLGSPEKLEAFKRWKFEDGTKEGLLKIMEMK